MAAKARRAAVIAIGVAALVAAPGAAAATTIGDPDVSANATSLPCPTSDSCMVYEHPYPSGEQWTAPFSGVIVRWRAHLYGSTGSVRLRVLHWPDSQTVKVVRSSGSESPSSAGVTTFAARVPIAAGDAIGIDLPGNSMMSNFAIGTEPGPGGSANPHFPAPADGDSFTDTPAYYANSLKIQLNADIEADADGDAFGDETQDRCFTDPSTHAGCPAPTVSGAAKVGRKLRARPKGQPRNPSFRWFRCSKGGGCHAIHGAKGRSYRVRAADVGHALRVRKSVTNRSGTQSEDSARTAVVPRQVVTRLKVKPKGFVPATSGGSVAPKGKSGRGAKVSFTLNESAAVRFKITRRVAGKGAIALRGRFRRNGVAGRNSFRFTGRLNGRRLPPGKYRLVAAPSKGHSASTGFRILP